MNDIAFPKVYVCNLNQLSKSLLYSIGGNDFENDRLIVANEFWFGYKMTLDDKMLMDSMKENIARTIGNGIQIDDAYQNCPDLILKAKWRKSPLKLFMNATVDCSTDYGCCCFINPGYDFDEHKNKNVNQHGLQGNKLLKIAKGKSLLHSNITLAL